VSAVLYASKIFFFSLSLSLSEGRNWLRTPTNYSGDCIMLGDRN